MLTYTGINKTDFVKEVQWHREQDMLSKGTYGTQNGLWKGCAVACSLRSLDKLQGRKPREEYNDHLAFENRGLWPEWLARLEDEIFEHLPEEDAMKWPEQLAKAVPVGVDITPVKWQFCAFLLKENIERVLTLEISEQLKEQVVSAIRGVLNVHETAIASGEWNESATSAARSATSAAWSAAWSATSAARSAAWSATSAARSAAWSATSAAWSAESAARSATSAARSATSAAWSAEYQRHAKELLRLLKAAK